MTTPLPYFRLSGFYLFYFATLGVLIPYWSPYLESLGFTIMEIGELTAILAATKIVAPNIWGWWADRRGEHLLIVRFASLASIIAFAGVFLGSGYWWMALIIALFSFFWNASLPQFEAVTLNHLGKSVERYSSIRLWGSVGFIVTVAALGPLLEWQGVWLVPLALILLMVGIWLSSLLIPAVPDPEHEHPHISLRSVLGRPVVVALLLVAFLNQAAHGTYYTFFTLYLESFGHDKGVIGMIWALSVGAEVAAFTLMARWMPRFGERNLLLVSLFLGTLRWLLTALFPQSLELMFLVQMLHAASFGVIHAVSIHMIHDLFRGKLQGRGQALYSSVSFGVGGVVGSLLGGIVWTQLGAEAIFLFSALLSAVALWVSWRWLYALEREPILESGVD
ncbi:MAG: MFS transporter [Gammaproteobacteria bacterium]|nr:MFS transporter [Gammaproteobacteria bacterium]MBT4605706.1 MFS transporter [Thiotrichales bacterium]MBT3473966.1 MFS transporter [Gammaproteobacteria bacterium]MBT3966317.1 MFS transporter [Gammaproteobacteria bacterium]MBT4331259.1 MFS transporter [Gammaproteobacteria bacterium]